MGEYEKLYEHIMLRRSDASVSFNGRCTLLKKLGFEERIRADHCIFTMRDIEEILNLQPKGKMAKPYHVKQVRNTILKTNLSLEA